MQSQGEPSDKLAPADTRGSDGYYYVDPTAQPQPAPGSSEFASDPGAAYGPGDPAAFAPLLLIVLVLALLAGLVALLVRGRGEKPEDVIVRALRAASKTALAAYGSSTIGAAQVFSSSVRKYLGPVLDLSGPVSAALKKLDEAVKGKTKEPAKGGDTVGPAPGSRVVVMGDYHAPAAVAAEKPKDVERDFTHDEHVVECRKAIEALAAVVMAADFRQRLAAARRALNNPPPAPRAEYTTPATVPGGGASTGSVGPRSAPERKPRHR